jgi:hypothetical protein
LRIVGGHDRDVSGSSGEDIAVSDSASSHLHVGEMIAQKLNV